MGIRRPIKMANIKRKLVAGLAAGVIGVSALAPRFIDAKPRKPVAAQVEQNQEFKFNRVSKKDALGAINKIPDLRLKKLLILEHSKFWPNGAVNYILNNWKNNYNSSFRI